MTDYSYNRTAQDTPILDDPEGDAADIERGLAAAKVIMAELHGALRTFEAGVDSNKPRKAFVGMTSLVGNLSMVVGAFGEGGAAEKLVLARRMLSEASRKYIR